MATERKGGTRDAMAPPSQKREGVKTASAAGKDATPQQSSTAVDTPPTSSASDEDVVVVEKTVGPPRTGGGGTPSEGDGVVAVRYPKRRRAKIRKGATEDDDDRLNEDEVKFVFSQRREGEKRNPVEAKDDTLQQSSTGVKTLPKSSLSDKDVAVVERTKGTPRGGTLSEGDDHVNARNPKRRRTENRKSVVEDDDKRLNENAVKLVFLSTPVESATVGLSPASRHPRASPLASPAGEEANIDEIKDVGGKGSRTKNVAKEDSVPRRRSAKKARAVTNAASCKSHFDSMSLTAGAKKGSKESENMPERQKSPAPAQRCRVDGCKKLRQSGRDGYCKSHSPNPKWKRKGKWTLEEETYANQFIHYYSSGILDLNKKDLRTYLAEKLNCDRDRVYRKYRTIPTLCNHQASSSQDADAARTELAELERRLPQEETPPQKGHRTCVVEGCKNWSQKRRLCIKHFRERANKYENNGVGVPPPAAAANRATPVTARKGLDAGIKPVLKTKGSSLFRKGDVVTVMYHGKLAGRVAYVTGVSFAGKFNSAKYDVSYILGGERKGVKECYLSSFTPSARFHMKSQPEELDAKLEDADPSEGSALCIAGKEGKGVDSQLVKPGVLNESLLRHQGGDSNCDVGFTGLELPSANPSNGGGINRLGEKPGRVNESLDGADVSFADLEPPAVNPCDDDHAVRLRRELQLDARVPLRAVKGNGVGVDCRDHRRCRRCGDLNAPKVSRCSTCRTPLGNGTAGASEKVLLEQTRRALLAGRDFWICTRCVVGVPSLTSPCGRCRQKIAFVPLDVAEFEEFVRNKRLADAKTGNLNVENEWRTEGQEKLKELEDAWSDDEEQKSCDILGQKLGRNSLLTPVTLDHYKTGPHGKFFCKFPSCNATSESNCKNCREHRQAPNSLVMPEDFDLISASLYLAMEQIVQYSLPHSGYRNLPAGFPGIACKHCLVKDARKWAKTTNSRHAHWFPCSKIAMYQSAIFTNNILKHVLNCPCCPSKVKEKLKSAEQDKIEIDGTPTITSGPQKITKDFKHFKYNGARKIFISRLWCRVHNLPLDDTVWSLPKKKQKLSPSNNGMNEKVKKKVILQPLEETCCPPVEG